MRYAIAAALVVLLIWVLFATGSDLVPSFLQDSTGGDRESAELERREGASSPSQARATRGSDPGGLEALEGRDIEDLSAAELARLARERALPLEAALLIAEQCLAGLAARSCLVGRVGLTSLDRHDTTQRSARAWRDRRNSSRPSPPSRPWRHGHPSRP